MKIKLSLITGLLSLLFLSSCNKESNLALESDTLIENLVDFDTAVETENLDPDAVQTRSGGYFSFKTLNAALHCTGLNAALFSGDKTIYAPSDAAFAKLGLNRHNVCDLGVDALTEILLYHVVDRKVSGHERGCVETIDGNIAQLSGGYFRRYINDSKIYFRFNQRGHGFNLRVYIITDVLTPPSNTIVEAAIATEKFSSLVAAVLAADPAIAAALSDPNAIFTVFAPTNQAFDNLVSALGATDLNDLVNTIGVDALSTVLLYHVVDGCAFSNDLSNGQEYTTLQGETITVDLHNLSIIDKTGTGAPLVADCLDILTSNGIVHTIDQVLLPDAILSNI